MTWWRSTGRAGALGAVGALGAAALLTLAGCGSAATGTATATAGSTSSTAKTISSPTKPSTTSSSSSSSSSSTSSSSSSSTETTTPAEWKLDVASHQVPFGFHAVSPRGDLYAYFDQGRVCLADWSGTQHGCALNADLSQLTGLNVQFSPQGTYLSVIFTGTDGLSVVWIVTVDTMSALVLTETGLQNAAGTPKKFTTGPSVWTQTESGVAIQQPPAGAETGDILLVSVDGSAPRTVAVRADVAGGAPQMWANDDFVILNPEIGVQEGTLWKLDQDGITQIGTGNYNPGGRIKLLNVQFDGRYAMYCNVVGNDFGALYEVNLATGETGKYFNDDDTCHGAAYSPDGEFVAISGAVGETNALGILATTSTEIPAVEKLDGLAQGVPAIITWLASDVITITPADLSNSDGLYVGVALLTR